MINSKKLYCLLSPQELTESRFLAVRKDINATIDQLRKFRGKYLLKVNIGNQGIPDAFQGIKLFTYSEMHQIMTAKDEFPGYPLNIPQNESAFVITDIFPINDPSKIVIDATFTNVSVPLANKIYFRFQDKSPEGSWNTKASLDFDDNGTYNLSLSSNDSSDSAAFPLRNLGRVIVSTDASETATVTGVVVNVY